jgi:hypothetical protein
MAYTMTEVSRQENFRADGISIVRVFQVEPYTSRFEAYFDLAGGVTVGSGGAYTVRYPARDPLVPFCRVKEIQFGALEEAEIVGHPTNSPIIAASYYRGPAILTVTYETPEATEAEIPEEEEFEPTEQSEIDLAQIQYKFSGRNITLPNQFMKWQTTNGGSEDMANTVARSDIAATKRMTSMQLVVTRNYVLNIPWTAIERFTGHVNLNPFAIAGRTWPSETVLFESADIQRKITNKAGSRYHVVTFNFSICLNFGKCANAALPPEEWETKLVGWNRLWDPRRSYWDRVVTFSNPPSRIYDADQEGWPGHDFRSLFTPSGN